MDTLMNTAPAEQFDGRPVRFAEFDLLQSRMVRDLIKVDAEKGLYLCLAASMRWADTDELVFKSDEEVWRLPTRHQQEIARLAGLAMRANHFFVDTPQGGEGGDPSR